MILETILGGIISGALSDNKVPAVIARKVTQAVVEQAVADPVIKNQMNMEPWWQSRVVAGSLVSALGVVVPPIAKVFGIDIASEEVVALGSAVVTLGGALYALYGRLWGGLAPLFGKK